MDMTPITWVLIALLVLLIAVGVFMLTRKPAARQDRHEEDGQISTDYGPGGEHVAAGDAGVTPSAPLYDQEAETGAVESSVEAEPIEAPVFDRDDSVGQDTATGGDLEIIEEEPAISVTETVEPAHVTTDSAEYDDHGDHDDHGDREQMAYGDPQTEDFASETVYAEAPVENEAGDSAHHADFVAGPHVVVAVDGPEDGHADTEDGHADTDERPGTEVSFVESGDLPDAVAVEENDDVPPDAAAAGFPGATGATAMASQVATDHEESDGQHGEKTADVVVAADAMTIVDASEDDRAAAADDDPVIEPASDDVQVVEAAEIDIDGPEVIVVDDHLLGDESTDIDDTVDTDDHDAAQRPDPIVEVSPYGPGSAIPGDDGQEPEGYEIKGNAGSMLFHTPESPSYSECTPEVFFESEDAARAAGFAHWDRKRR